MTNADKFKAVFGIYSEEFWAKPEGDMLNWISSEYQEPKTNADVQPVKWTPVTERLPELDTEVLVYAYNHNIWVWEYHGNAWEAEDGYYHEADVVTHWMPLPEPPKVGET